MSRISIAFFILSVALIGTEGINLPKEIIQAAAIIRKICRDRVEVKEEILKQTETGELPDNRELKCYIDCIFREIDVIDRKGRINFSHIYYILPDELVEIVDRITKTCGTVHGADSCETAWLTTKCYFDTDPKAKRVAVLF